MLINNANITGSLIVQGSTVLSGSLTVSGSTLNNLSASYALTASYVASVANLSTFQIASGSVTASVNINSGSFTLASGSNRLFFISSSGDTTLSGSLAISNLTGSGVRYMVADSAGNITAQTASAAIRYSQTYTASAGQTTFNVTNGYTTGLVDVYLNGTKLLDGPEYLDTSGTNIVLTTGSFAGDIVEIITYQPASGVTNNSLRQLTSFTATAGQTTFSASYVPGLLDVYYNGSRLNTIEYTAANGNSIVLATGSNAGDLVDVLVYSYQVGAFSGIGGTGIANQMAYWNTTNSITGSPNFVVSSSVLILSGSSHIVTGSLLVSGSVGIGTTPNPTTNLHIAGANGVIDSVGNLMVMTNNTASQNFGGQITMGGFYSGSSLSTSFGAISARKENATNNDFLGYIAFATQTGSLVERMRITSNGNVGINESTPLGVFHVRGIASADVLYRLEPTNNNYAAKLLLSSRSSGDGGMRYGSGGGNNLDIFSYDTMRFYCGTANLGGAIGNLRMSITQGGLVDIPNRNLTPGSMPAGSVIQVVSYNLASGFSTTSASDQDTGLKVSITPTSSTSKILVLVSANVRATNTSGNCYVTAKLVRGAFNTGTSLHNGFAVMGNFNSTDIRGSVSYSYLDSPATTSSTQYVISMNSQYAATVYMDSTTSPSTITLLEIAQ